MHRSSNDRQHFIRVGVLIIISTILMTWMLKLALPLPTKASAQAFTVDRVLDVHIVLISFFFSLVVVFMLYSLVVFRRRAGDTSEGEHFEGNTALEIVWTVVPLIVVLFLGYLGVRTLNAIVAPQPGEITVNVKGFQWAWTFDYPEGGFTSPELVLPVNQPAVMEMTATDVLHSFWVPEFRVKQDLVPGQTTHLRFTPVEVGEYKLRCAELCGLTHWNMLATVRVVPQDEYDAWMTEQAAKADTAVAGVVDEHVSD